MPHPWLLAPLAGVTYKTNHINFCKTRREALWLCLCRLPSQRSPLGLEHADVALDAKEASGGSAPSPNFAAAAFTHEEPFQGR